MARANKRDIVAALLDRHGQTYAEQLRINLQRSTPGPLFQMLVASILFSTRISANIAVSAARALFDKGWTTPRRMAQSTWRQRTDTLNRAGYARYDESTSRYLGATVDLLLDTYGGDLRKLRQAADRQPDQERHRLKDFTGLGDVGVDIFFREVQLVWDELYPFADQKALQGARSLGLGSSAKALASLTPRDDFPRLVAALVRTSLAKDEAEIRSAA